MRPPSLFGPYVPLAQQPGARPSLFSQLPRFEAPSVQLPELEPLNTPSAFSDPGMSAPPQREKKRGWFGRFTDSVRERMVPIPDTFAQMVSPEELRQIRRMSLGTENASATALGGIASVLAAKKGAQSEAEQARMLAQRQEIMAKYAAGPNDTPEQTAQRLYSMFTDLVNLGDYEGASKAGEVLKSQTELLRGPKPPEPVKGVEIDRGDRVDFVNPVTGEVIQSYPKGLPPQPPRDTSARDEQRRTSRLDRLALQYERAVKEAQEQFDGIGMTLTNEVPKALSRDGAAQYAVIVQFVKALDPGSVAREGEVSLARQAQSIWADVQTALARVQSGGLVGPQLIQQMADLMRQRQTSYQRRIARTQQQYRLRANNPDDVDAAFYAPPPPDSGTGSAPVTGARARAALQPRP